MAQFVNIGGGAQWPTRMRPERDRAPSAGEMLALIMQAGNNRQDRVSATEALAMVIPLMQGAMGQQNFAAQLEQQGKQFGQTLDFQQTEAGRAYELARLASERQPTSEQRIAEMRAANEPQIKALEASLEQMRQQGQLTDVQVKAALAQLDATTKDRSLGLIREGAETQIGDVRSEAEADKNAIATDAQLREIASQGNVSDAMQSTVGSIQAKDETQTLYDRVLGYGNPGDADVLSTLSIATGGRKIEDPNNPFYRGDAPELNKAESIQILDAMMKDPNVLGNISKDTRVVVNKFLASPSAQAVRKQKRDEDRKVIEDQRKIEAEARASEKEIRGRARVAQRSALSGDADIGAMLSSVGGSLYGQSGGNGPTGIPAGPFDWSFGL